jgi:hypothetical protein
MVKNNISRSVSFFLLSFLLLTANNAQAALIPCGTAGNPCQFCHIFVLLNNIIELFLQTIVPLVVLLFIVRGGFKMVTSVGDTNKFEDAKKMITAAMFGMIIILISYMVLNVFLSAIGVAEWTGLGTWWEIQCP